MGEPHARKMTWIALLGHWMDFARSALALPDDAEGRAWKAAVAPIIGLQAVTMALGEAHQLEPDERALGLDRAHLLIQQHTRELEAIFPQQAMHPHLEALIRDARSGLERAQEA